jgi:hypothetical protein
MECAAGWHALRYSEGRAEPPTTSSSYQLREHAVIHFCAHWAIRMQAMLFPVLSAAKPDFLWRFGTPFGVPQGVPPDIRRLFFLHLPLPHRTSTCDSENVHGTWRAGLRKRPERSPVPPAAEHGRPSHKLLSHGGPPCGASYRSLSKSKGRHRNVATMLRPVGHSCRIGPTPHRVVPKFLRCV